jgi:hypothetical protein
MKKNRSGRNDGVLYRRADAPGECEVMVGGRSAEGCKARFSVKAGIIVKMASA